MDYLYHYTKFETAVTKILPFNRLKLNIFEQMNDPLENLKYLTNCFDNVIDNGLGDDYVRARLIQKEWQILCFSTDSIIDNLNICGGLLSRMWDQYGNNNSGICLVINFEKFIKENEETLNSYNIKKDKVEYANWMIKTVPVPMYGQNLQNTTIDKLPIVDVYDVSPNSLGEIAIRNFFFSKNIDWISESEYRFVAYTKSKEDIYLSIEQSLDYIILGINFSKHLLPCILKLVPFEKIFALKIDMLGKIKKEKLPNEYRNK